MKQNQIKNTNSQIKGHKDPLGVHAIAAAEDTESLMKAFESSRANFYQLFESQALIELREIAKEVLSGEGGQEAIHKYIQKYQEAALMNGVVNGKVVEGSVNNGHQKQVMELGKQFIAEYQATAVSELLIIDMVINAYFRSLHSSRIYSSLSQKHDGTFEYSQLKINFMKELGKQIELANKQFVSAITLLKEMKQPQINIKVQSKQAFVGQNQQFNKNA